MKHRLSTEIDIDAPAEAVWGVLTDLGNYHKWNPFMVSSKGKVAVGERLVNRMEPPGGKAMTFKPTVTVATENSVFEWQGHAGIPGLFDGRHRFELQETANGTKLIHTEDFSGLLVRPFKKSLDTQTLSGFRLMNEALKHRAEKIAR